jgi:hypothetical protein
MATGGLEQDLIHRVHVVLAVAAYSPCRRSVAPVLRLGEVDGRAGSGRGRNSASAYSWWRHVRHPKGLAGKRIMPLPWTGKIVGV